MRDALGTGIKVTEKFEVNSILWLRSLPCDERGPSQRMIEDIETLALSNENFRFEIMEIGSAADMLDTLSLIAERCRSGLRPILHFDCHGSEALGVNLAPSGENLGWATLADALREINVAAKNNICCIFGVCFGMHLSMDLALSKPTPYFLTIAPEREIAVGILEEKFPRFYNALYETGNITASYQTTLAPDLSAFQCQEVFGKAFATYIVNHTSGSAMKLRRESLLTRLLALLGLETPSPHQLDQARKHIRTGLKLTQEQVDHFANIFLIGRKPGFGLVEIQRLADSMRDRRAAEQKRALKAERMLARLR
jgi:hypothetical protein